MIVHQGDFDCVGTGMLHTGPRAQLPKKRPADDDLEDDGENCCDLTDATSMHSMLSAFSAAKRAEGTQAVLEGVAMRAKDKQELQLASFESSFKKNLPQIRP